MSRFEAAVREAQRSAIDESYRKFMELGKLLEGNPADPPVCPATLHAAFKVHQWWRFCPYCGGNL